MRRFSKVLFVALIGFAITVIAIFVRDLLSWESCGDDAAMALADVEIYGAPSPAQCSIAKTGPTVSQPTLVVIAPAAAVRQVS
jgi:hypothetical protein